MSRLRKALTAFVNLLGLAQVVKWIEKLLGLGEHIEFIVHHARSLGEVGVVIEALLDPPPLVGLAIVVTGLLLIWWDIRRKRADASGVGKPTVRQFFPPPPPPQPQHAQTVGPPKRAYRAPHRRDVLKAIANAQDVLKEAMADLSQKGGMIGLVLRQDGVIDQTELDEAINGFEEELQAAFRKIGSANRPDLPDVLLFGLRWSDETCALTNRVKAADGQLRSYLQRVQQQRGGVLDGRYLQDNIHIQNWGNASIGAVQEWVNGHERNLSALWSHWENSEGI
jgi:hypothetical protein